MTTATLEQPATKKQNTASEDVTVKDLAVCFSLTLGRFSLRKKVNADEVTVDAEKRAISVAKKILESEKYDRIKRLDAEIRAFVHSRSLPSLLRRGIYLLPLRSVSEVEKQIAKFKELRQKYINEFVEEYSEAREKARLNLRSLFREEDYPSAESLPCYFSFNTNIFSAEVPDTLERVSAIAFEMEKEKARRFWEEQQETIVTVLRAEFKELVDHLVDRLKPDEDGKPKVFRSAVLKNFQEWIDLFKDRNIVQDQEVAVQVEKARKILANVTPDDIRDALTTRNYVKGQMEKIKANTDKLVQTRPSRMIVFDE